MLSATIRPIEEVSVDVKGEGLEAVYERLEEARPEGFDLVLAPVSMEKGETAIKATGTYARRDGLREIQADTMDGLREQVPEGWRMLNVCRVSPASA